METTLLDVLREARMHVEKGWCQHVIAKTPNWSCSPKNPTPVPENWETNCQVCIQGAIDWVIFGAPWGVNSVPYNSYTVTNQRWAVVHALSRFLPEPLVVQPGSELDDLIDFNDAEGRKLQDVLDLFDKAIQLIEDQSAMAIL